MSGLILMLLGTMLQGGWRSAGADGASRTSARGATAQCPTEVGWSPEHYDLDVRIEYAEEQLRGSVAITVRNRTEGPLATVPLLLYRLMKVDSVEGPDGAGLEFTQRVEAFADYPRFQVNFIEVQLPLPVPAGGTVTVSLHYGGYLLGMSEAFRYVKETIDPAFTMIRDDSNAYPTVGYPCYRANVKRPLNRWSYDARISVPDSLVVANGGLEVDRNVGEGLAEFHYVSKVPSWRMDFAIAPYRRFASGRNVVFALPEDAGRAVGILSAMDETLDLYTRWFGPLQAFQGLAVIEIPEGYGSQTDATAIIQRAEAFKNPEDLHELYHELSHKWNVKATDAHPPRIEEGLATFLESLTVEELEGRTYLDPYMDRILPYIQRQYREHPEYATASIAQFGDRGFESLSYTVGAVFFRLLYAETGAEGFRSIFRDLYADRFESGADIDDIMSYVRARRGTKVERLIDDWVYGTRYAELISQGKSIEDLLAAYASGEDGSRAPRSRERTVGPGDAPAPRPERRWAARPQSSSSCAIRSSSDSTFSRVER